MWPICRGVPSLWNVYPASFGSMTKEYKWYLIWTMPNFMNLHLELSSLRMWFITSLSPCRTMHTRVHFSSETHTRAVYIPLCGKIGCIKMLSYFGRPYMWKSIDAKKSTRSFLSSNLGYWIFCCSFFRKAVAGCILKQLLYLKLRTPQIRKGKQ